MVNLFTALRHREEGFGSRTIDQSLRDVAKCNLRSGHSHQRTIKFPDPVVSVMDPYVFTLKQVLKCWNQHTMELQWQYPAENSGVDEKLIPLFKLGRFVLCSEVNRKCFKVLSLGQGKVCASSEVSIYESIHRIGDRIFIKKHDGPAFEFNWKEDQKIEKRDGTVPCLYSSYISYDLMRRKNKNIGFSLEDACFTKPEQLSIFSVDTVKQSEVLFDLGKNDDFAISHHSIFRLNDNTVSVLDISVDSPKIEEAITIYQLSSNREAIREIYVHNGYLFVKITTFPNRYSDYVIFDAKSFAKITTLKIEDIFFSENDYADRQISLSRFLHFENGSCFRIMGSYLQVVDYKNICSDEAPHTHPLHTITSTGIKIGKVEETEDLKPLPNLGIVNLEYPGTDSDESTDDYDD